MRHRRRTRGVMLGIVIVLLALVFAAGIFALWSLRSESSSAGQDRLSRQLFDCAEQGLAYGKQFFGKAYNTSSSTFASYLAANICSTTPKYGTLADPSGPLPCWTSSSPGPFPTSPYVTGTPPTGYPVSQIISMDTRQSSSSNGGDFQWTVGVYNNPGDTAGGTCSTSSPNCYNTDGDDKVIIYSRCTDLNTMQQRAVQALVSITITTSTDYTGQAGRGFRNQGNQNF